MKGEKLLLKGKFYLVTLFIVGSFEIGYTIIKEIPLLFNHVDGAHGQLLVGVIEGIDLYLIAVVLMIFGFGIYELFISKIDIARQNLDITILEIENLDELKQKIIKVIIMVLIVTFFERILQLGSQFEDPIHMLYFAISILALSIGIYLVRKEDSHKR